jgi:hypothetical protein
MTKLLPSPLIHEEEKDGVIIQTMGISGAQFFRLKNHSKTYATLHRAIKSEIDLKHEASKVFSAFFNLVYQCPYHDNLKCANEENDTHCCLSNCPLVFKNIT